MTDWVRKYQDIPFRPDGRDRSGCDCYGLLRLVFLEERGFVMPLHLDDHDIRDNQSAGAAMVDGFAAEWFAVDGPEKPFDAIHLRCDGAPMHVALIVGDGLMFHTRRGTGPCLESYRSKKWERRILGFYRPRGHDE